MVLVKDILLKSSLFFFYISTVFFHRQVNELVDIFYKRYSFGATNRAIVFILVLPFVISLIIFFILSFKKDVRRLIVSLSVIFLPMTVYYYFLFVSNVETIHYIQYTIISFLLMKMRVGIWYTFFAALVLGFIDEWYQYSVLYADRADVYLDFNDILLNLHGALIGILIYTLVNTNVLQNEFRKESEIT